MYSINKIFLSQVIIRVMIVVLRALIASKKDIIKTLALNYNNVNSKVNIPIRLSSQLSLRCNRV